MIAVTSIYLPSGLPFQAIQDLDEIDFADLVTHGDHFIRLESASLPPLADGLHVFFRFFGDLPICQFSWIRLAVILETLKAICPSFF